MKFNKYGLIGEHLSHSLSPVIHGEIFKRINVQGIYELYEIKAGELEERTKAFKSEDVRGLNVTIPYKVNVIKYLDGLSFEAEKIGAVNTIAFGAGKLIGYNTDYHGFGMLLKKSGIDVAGKKATILGTGGVSRAVTQYLIDNGIDKIVYASRNSKASEDDSEIEIIPYDKLDGLKGDIIINCTPSGMYPHVSDCPVASDVIGEYSFAVDLIYNPLETIFLKHARELGLKSANGLYMLTAQAVKAQEIWNKINISEEIMDEVYEIIRVKFV